MRGLRFNRNDLVISECRFQGTLRKTRGLLNTGPAMRSDHQDYDVKVLIS
jgi:hypothetical protein